MRKGRELERFIEYLENALLGKEGVTINSPERLTDKRTGESREFDVVIRLTKEHHQSLIAVECRDRISKVGSPEVEQFYQKCLDCGVNQPIIVSSNGFAKPAIKKAQKLGIRCLELDQVDSVPQRGMISLPFSTTSQNFRILNSELEWIGLEPIDNERDYTVFDPTGSQWGQGDLQKALDEKWKNQCNLDDPGVFETTLILDAGFLCIKDRSSGMVIGLKEIHAHVTYEVWREKKDIKYFDYVDRTTGGRITSLAVMDDSVLGGHSYLGIAIQKSDNEIAFTFIPK